MKSASQKKREVTRNFTEAHVDREAREREAVLKEAGLLGSISGKEAAYDDMTNVELCRDVACKFAQESAKKTDEPIGVVRDRYEAIATELRCVHATQLRAALSEEYARDRKGLLRFLDAVFKRWREIDQPDSLFRQRLLMHQLTGTSKEIANVLEEVGAVAKNTTEQQSRSLRSKIRQNRSRDQKAALKRRGL